MVFVLKRQEVSQVGCKSSNLAKRKNASGSSANHGSACQNHHETVNFSLEMDLEIFIHD